MQNIYAKIKDMLENHQVGASIIVVAGDSRLCPMGTKLLVNEAGEIIEGYINKDVFIRIQNELLKIIQNKIPQSINIDIADLVNVSSPAQLTLFIDPIYPKTRLIILGGGHVALPLAKLGKFLDFQVTVVDDRPSFANFFRFGEADEVICEDFEKAIEQLPFDVNTFVVIVTRGHHYDKVCLGSVLKSPKKPAYVGMIGSRKKISAIMNALQGEGASAEQLETVHSPIGLDIGAQTPEEIAISILTEIIMVKRYGESRGFETKSLKDISLIREKEEKVNG